jgi:hypothetical protein
MKRFLVAVFLLLGLGCQEQPLSTPPHPTSLSVHVDTIASGTAVDLYGVSFPSSNVGYCVGDMGTVMKTVDGGATWSRIASSYFPLEAVLFWSDFEGVVVGENGVYSTHNGGASWDTANYTGGSVNKFRFNLQTINSIARSSDGRLILGGLDWGGSPNSPRACFYESVDNDGLLWITPKVSRWQQPGAENIASLTYNSGNYIALCSIGLPFVLGSRLYAFSNPDSFWRTTYTSINVFNGVGFLSSSDAMTVGDSGFALLSTDAGSNWSSVAVSSTGNVLVVGDSAVLSAQGSPWTLSSVSHMLGPLRAVTFANSTHAIAVGLGGRIMSITFVYSP